MIALRTVFCSGEEAFGATYSKASPSDSAARELSKALSAQREVSREDSSFSSVLSGRRGKKSRPVLSSTSSTVTAKYERGFFEFSWGRMKPMAFRVGSL